MVGTKLDGTTVSQSLSVGSTLGFTTFAVTGFNDVTAVTWFQHDPTDLVEWDNVTVQSTGPLNITGADFGSMRIANAAPVAVNDTYSTGERRADRGRHPGVLGNDTDPDGDPIAAVLVSGPAHGTLSLNADGSFTYTPASGYNGPDSFTYKANDGPAELERGDGVTDGQQHPRRGLRAGAVGAGQYQYRPTGSPWAFAGNAGIAANNSGFTSGNPPAPEGTQVAFLQTTGSFSQAVAGWAAGSYVLTFYAAQRGNYQASRQDFQVLVDGAVVGTFTPSGTSYQSLHDGRVHRHRRVAHDHVPGPGQRRRRQHRLHRPGRPSTPSTGQPGSPTRVSSRCRWGPASSSTARPARPGPSPATPGIAANNSGFTCGQPAGPRGHPGRLPPEDRLVQPERSPAGPPAPTC